jgi:ABC-type microcin C transport system permease subunit YejE
MGQVYCRGEGRNEGWIMWDLTNNLNHRIRLQQNKPVPMASTIQGVLKIAAVCRENPIVTLDEISKESDQ